MPTTTTYPGCTPCCGGIATSCCPSNNVPETLFATLSSADCPAMNFSCTLTYDAGSGSWFGISSTALCGVDWVFVQLRCQLAGGTYHWQLRYSLLTAADVTMQDLSSENTDYTNGTGSCSPFLFSGTLTVLLPFLGTVRCCGAGKHVNWSVSE